MQNPCVTHLCWVLMKSCVIDSSSGHPEQVYDINNNRIEDTSESFRIYYTYAAKIKLQYSCIKAVEMQSCLGYIFYFIYTYIYIA